MIFFEKQSEKLIIPVTDRYKDTTKYAMKHHITIKKSCKY